jgi:hypothetical protein
MCPSRNHRPDQIFPFLFILAFGLAGSVLAQSGQSTILTLRNGDRLTGTILRDETNQVVLKTTWFNVVVVPVTEIKTREPVPAPAAQAVPAIATAPAIPPGALIPAPPIEAKKPKPKKWAGEAQAGIDLLYSEHNRQLYSGRLKLTYFDAPFRGTLDYLAAYGKTDGLVSDNHMFGSVKTDWDFANRWYAYTLGGVGYDLVRKIDLRYEIGPGLGFHAFKGSNFVLNLESGANYQVEHRSDLTETESFYWRLAEDAIWRISPRISWDEKFEFFPKIERMEEYRFRLESNLRFAILNNLSLIFTALDQYDTDPAQGVPQNSLQLISSVGVKF